MGTPRRRRRTLCIALCLSAALTWATPAWGVPSTFYLEDYPTSYHLTNAGYVTPVKLQSPWPDCWAFAIASALESSILRATAQIEGTVASESTEGIPRLSNLNTSVDISERAIAWLAHEVQTEESAGSQAGEGYHLVDASDPHSQLAEGNFEMVESQLLAGQSLIAESTVPYAYNGYDGWPRWYSLGSRSGTADDARLRDWSVNPTLRTSTELGWTVSEIYKLPNPAVLQMNADFGDYDYVGYDAQATRAIKGALMQVGAVAIALEADSYLPADIVTGRSSSTAPSEHFTYSTWSQYNNRDYIDCNHAVTIVGWDDSYSASNFQGTESGQPPGNGAWLCKNNWGSDALYESMAAMGDATHWGLRDEIGRASGFFWLSYYDHSIFSPVAFGVEPIGERQASVYQYDYLGSSEYTSPISYSTDAWVANAFTANETELVRSVSAQTFDKDQVVDIRVYRVPAPVDLATASAEEVFGQATLVQEQSDTFEQAGFYRIDLASPVLVNQGEHFIVAERVTGTAKNSAGIPYEATFLNVEMAYTQNLEGVPQSTMATVVSNPGETYLGFDGEWMTVANYNALYAEDAAANGRTPDIIFGNTLAKAYTDKTTMAERDQIYETKRL